MYDIYYYVVVMYIPKKNIKHNYNVLQLDWVCQNAWKSTLGQSMFFIGSVVGSLVFGILADKIGRLHILVISNLIAMVGNVLTMFATDVMLFSMCRLISGLATDSNFVMMYILGETQNKIYFSNG